jgi:hypothetical protein
MTDTLTRRWLSLLLLASVVAIIQVSLFPRRPQAGSLPKPPNIDGGSWQLVEEQPVRRKRDLATSTSRTYALQGPILSELPIGGLQLNLTAMAVRNVADLQVAFLTSDNPSLQLRGRRVLAVASNDELAIGQIVDRPTWQTCLLPKGRHGVTRQGLNRGNFSNQPLPPKWLLWLGVRDWPIPNCLLVTISAEGSATPAVEASMQPLVEDLIAELGTKN